MPEALDPAIAAQMRTGEHPDQIELIEIAHAGGVARLAAAPVDGAAPMFGGVAYTPVALETEGWSATAKGSLPRPRIRIALRRDVGSTGAAAQFLALVAASNDFLGAKVTRLRTFRRHLDDGAEPNAAGWWGREIWLVEQRSALTPLMIEFTLRSPADQAGVMMPRGQNIPHCQLIYRRWDGSGFVFLTDRRQCPYAGAAMFDLANQPAANGQNDRCNKGLEACRIRFGQTAELPYRGNPGAGKVGL